MLENILNILFAVIFALMIVATPRTLIILIIYKLLKNAKLLTTPVFILIIISMIICLIYDIMEFCRNWLTNN